ncbi:HFX_2341 family transcriptional regulator domain-containing protein [Halostagnicola bangensis]
MTRDTELRSIVEVHIAPLGYEFDRIKEPVLEYNADILYLLRDPQQERLDYHTALETTLTEHGVSVNFRKIDLGDMYDVLGEITTIADSYADDIVRINVSSGPKLAAIGAALACMATDASGYYVHPESRSHPVEETPRTKGMRVAEQLPSYPLETPTEDQVQILNYIDDTDDSTYTPKKSDLITFAEKAGLNFITRSEPANDKAKFALLNNRVITPLADNGYVQVESVGRSKQVSLTDTGHNALRAFRHKL